MRPSTEGGVTAEIAEALRGTDWRGDAVLHHLAAPRYLEMLLAQGAAYKVVPGTHWNAIMEDGVAYADITCVCGRAHRQGRATVPGPCECGRWFFYGATEVWAFGPFAS